MAVLSYNEERYGLERCNMIAFYPWNGAVKDECMRPKTKAIEQAHMVDHVLASVSAVYADFRLAASTVVRKRHLFRAVSRRSRPHSLRKQTGRSLQASLQQSPYQRHRRRSRELSQHQGDDVHRIFWEPQPERPEGVIDWLAGGQECRGQ